MQLTTLGIKLLETSPNTYNHSFNIIGQNPFSPTQLVQAVISRKSFLCGT